MVLQKRGHGEVLKDEDVKKTASTESDEDRQQRQAALEEENKDADR